MPNHVQNIIAYEGPQEEIDRMREAIKDDEYGLGTVDFQKILPMPSDLNLTSGSIESIAVESVLRKLREARWMIIGGGSPCRMSDEEYKIRRTHFSETDEQLNELGLRYISNVVKYGAADWYDWCVANWGTKWNAYDYEKGEDYSGREDLRFQTAWNAPDPILYKLSEMFPEITFDHQYADEDIGRNFGHNRYRAGEREELLSVMSGSDKAVRFACHVWDMDYDEYMVQSLEPDEEEAKESEPSCTEATPIPMLT